ncbi:hypothetical protein BOW53_10965 [Solemya pervernicosa gill symbiont]|uniref:PEGA domain-containing protein n=1 Tax=Solemya pervernicosa gill symbiont TaxID=642797 RepID=A0A1T2L3A4_9GAMM|nr:hypothetical protein [Solemya pervernicosa gill symbiont]OOZ39598.1 hypothetical protein BOW53_10965 [Solemya pervernicosa gill symbiont]
MKKITAGLALSVALLSGCSSIISKSDYAVAITSHPENANFVVTNKSGMKVDSGMTPATVSLKSSSGFFEGETYTIVVSKDGYSDKSYTMTSSIDGWYFGNILFGGIIGMLIVDPMTGAMYNLPEQVVVSLDQSVAEIKSDTLKIATIDSLSTEQVLRLQKIQ